MRKIYIKSLKLAKDDTWKNDGSHKKLERLVNECKIIIKEKYNYGRKDLEEYIKYQNSNILKNNLKYDPDKLNIEYYL